MFRLFPKKRVYLDYASATPVYEGASEAMKGARNLFGNPGSIHNEGVIAKKALEKARESIAHDLGVKSRTVIFTSGATEANNLAIMGTFKRIVLGGSAPNDTHWITTAIEHPSVLACFKHIEEMGGLVDYIAPSEMGQIRVEDVVSKVNARTVLVSIGWANGEIGAVMPLRKISHALRKKEEELKTNIIFHSDAGQAPLFFSPRAHDIGLDLMTLDSAKLYGPRGTGVLFVDNRAALLPIVLGGGQERGLRAGTENIEGAVGFATALIHVSTKRKGELARAGDLKRWASEEIQRLMPGAQFNSSLESGLPHIVSISIPGNRNGEYLALALDHKGFSVSTKSACREGEGSTSHVVAALGGEAWRATNTLRISFGMMTTKREVNSFIQQLAKLVNI